MRGPQGTLWGRNATGGAVSFTSVKPSQDFDAYIIGKIGTENNRGFEGAIGGAISDTVSGRLSGMGNWHDPFVKNRAGPDIFDDNTYSLRGQLLFEINDDVSLLVNARMANSDNLDGWSIHTRVLTMILLPNLVTCVEKIKSSQTHWQVMQQKDYCLRSTAQAVTILGTTNLTMTRSQLLMMRLAWPNSKQVASVLV